MICLISDNQKLWKNEELQWNSVLMYKDVWKKVSILYNRKPSKVNIGPYNTFILKFLKSSMNLQFVTGVHAGLHT